MALDINKYRYVQLIYNTKSYYIEEVYYIRIKEMFEKQGTQSSNSRIFLYAIERGHFLIVEIDFIKYLLNPQSMTYEEI